MRTFYRLFGPDYDQALNSGPFDEGRAQAVRKLYCNFRERGVVKKHPVYRPYPQSMAKQQPIFFFISYCFFYEILCDLD